MFSASLRSCGRLCRKGIRFFGVRKRGNFDLLHLDRQRQTAFGSNFP